MTSVSAGGEHTLVYNEKTKTLFSAGACGLGWCRQHPLTDYLFHLRQVQLGQKQEPSSSLFHASYYHNLAVGADTGRLYSWGCGTFTDGGMDGVIPALGQGLEATDLGQPPRAIRPAFFNNRFNKIVQLSGGAYHSIFLTDLGHVYTFGAGQLGQLGRPVEENADASGLPVDPTPTKVTGIPTEEKVAQIGAGFYNTLAACQSGALYCAGENQNQQCGVGPNNLQEMTRVQEVDNVESAEGGYCHTLVKTVAGKVFSMGCGEEGQRGVGVIKDEDDDDEMSSTALETVTQVELPKGQKALQIAAGANHSVILGENGVAYTFGANDVGQCGVPSDKTSPDDDDDDDDDGGPVWGPKSVVIPATAGKVVQVSAGYAHTALTTSTGRVFAFGQNDNGQLGIGRQGPADEGQDSGPSLRPAEVKIK